MRGTVLPALAGAVLAWGTAVAKPDRRYVIAIPSLPADARVMGFTITVRDGRIATLGDCPPGWTITVDNDPSWQATIKGQAIVGAASVAGRELPALFRLAATPEAGAAVTDGPISATGTVAVLRDSDEVDLRPSPIIVSPLREGDR